MTQNYTFLYRCNMKIEKEKKKSRSINLLSIAHQSHGLNEHSTGNVGNLSESLQ